MHILVISDIHANLTALESVINAAGNVDATWCLGDLVGYGPDPNECIELIRTLPNLTCILGNHDSAAVDQIDAETFNPEARTALIWTRYQLSKSNRDFLASLADRYTWQDITLVHGSPRQPVWEYILDIRTATQNFENFTTSYCLIGHTHLPVIYSLSDTRPYAHLTIPEPNQTKKIPVRSIINPGSVGQPRDRDPRASFAILDTDSMTWDYRRVTYDIVSVQVRMEAFRLPERHIQRLSAGW